jgi:hypothetical protein
MCETNRPVDEQDAEQAAETVEDTATEATEPAE